LAIRRYAVEVAIVPHFPAVVRQLRYDLRKLKGRALWNAILTEVIAHERLPSLAGRPRQSPEDSRDSTFGNLDCGSRKPESD
jgi:hypothetical protein